MQPAYYTNIHLLGVQHDETKAPAGFLQRAGGGASLHVQGRADERTSPVWDVNENGNVIFSVPHVVGANLAFYHQETVCTLGLAVSVAGDPGVLAVALLREFLNLLDLASQQSFKLFHNIHPFWPGL